MARQRAHHQEIDLRAPASTEGLEVVEIDPLAEPPAPRPLGLLDLLAGLPPFPVAPYAEPSDDRTGAKGIWTAIANL